MFWVASPFYARHSRFLCGVLLFAAVVLAAGWPARLSSTVANGPVVAEEPIATGDFAPPVDRSVNDQDQWSSYPFAVPHPGQSHQGQVPPVRLALTFGDSAWDAVAADVCGAVVVTEQRAGAGQTARRSAPPWGSLQVQGVRLQI